MQYSPCIDAIFFEADEVNLEKRIEYVKQAGYKIYEFWSWWDKDIKEIKKLNDELGLSISTMCTKFISLTDETKRDEYIAGLKESIEAAKYLGVKSLISQTGDDLGIDRQVQKQSLIDGLSACAPILEEAGITLLVEPLNLLVDHQGYFLSTSDETLEIMYDVNHPNIKVLFDVYHQQITEGNLCRNIEKLSPFIAHFHFADNPGRLELGTGEINYHNVIKTIKNIGYDGALGLEFFPTSSRVVKMAGVQTDYPL